MHTRYEKIATAQWKVTLQPPALRAMPQGVCLPLTHVRSAANKDCTVLHEIRRAHVCATISMVFEEVGTSGLIKMIKLNHY